MPVQFPCPSCGRMLSVPEERLGVTGPCPFCRALITAPTEGVGAPRRVAPTGALLSEAWALVTQNAGLVVGGFLLAFLIQMAVLMAALVFFVAFSAAGGSISDRIQEARFLLNLVSLAISPLGFGPLFILDELLTRGQSDFGALFLGFRRYFTFLGAQILLTLAVLGGSLLLLVGALFVATALSLTFAEIVDRGVGALEAVQTSWQETAGYRWRLFGNLVLFFLVGMAGILVIGVGVFLTYPVFLAGYLLLYREVRGLQGRTR